VKISMCIVTVLILISSVAYSKDLGPGTISVAGTSGLKFSQTTTKIEGMDDLKADVFSFELNSEYYFMNNIGIGLIFMYDSMKQDIPMSDERLETSSMMIGPQVVYNVSVNEQVSVPVFFAVGSASIDDGEDDYSGWAWVAGGGLRYFVSDHVSFDGYLFYDSMSIEDGIEMDMTDFGAQVGISVYLSAM
jgi:hypothetical protein